MDANFNANKNNRNNSKNNNNLGLIVFVAVFIVVVIVIFILMRAVFSPSSGTNSSSGNIVAFQTKQTTTTTTTSPLATDDGNGTDPANSNHDSNGTYNTFYEMTVSSEVNVRSGAGSNCSKLGVLSAGEKVKVIGETNGWYQIDYNGNVNAFVYSSYLSGDRPAFSSSSTTQNQYAYNNGYDQGGYNDYNYNNYNDSYNNNNYSYDSNDYQNDYGNSGDYSYDDGSYSDNADQQSYDNQ